MAAFCWMLIEGVYLYLFVVKVYNIDDKMKVSHGFSWGNYELKTHSLFDNLWESETWITMNITISNPQVYPPSLFPYRWALQQEPDRGLKAMSAKLCKREWLFSPVIPLSLILVFCCILLLVCLFVLVYSIYCCCFCFFCCSFFVISLLFFSYLSSNPTWRVLCTCIRKKIIN